MTHVKKLAAVIDFLARQCFHGLPALMGKAPKPTWDHLREATEYTQSGGEYAPSLESTALTLAEIESILEAIPWEDIVAAVQWISRDPMTCQDWNIYLRCVIYKGMPLGRCQGSSISAVAEWNGISESTVRRVLQRVPEQIASAVLFGTPLLLVDRGVTEL